MNIGKISRRAEYRMDERFQNFNFWRKILVWQIKKILEISWFFHLENSKNFLNFITSKTVEFLLLKNSQNFSNNFHLVNYHILNFIWTNEFFF